MSSSPTDAPPEGGDQNRGATVIAVFWVMCTIVVTTIVLRFYSRTKMQRLGSDDWMMLFTVILFVIFTCFVTYDASIGGARHLFYLLPEERVQAIKYNWLGQPFAIFALATGKTAVALLVLRIIGPNTVWRKWMLYFTIFSVVLLNGLGTIFTFVQCVPSTALWNPTVSASCWDPSVQNNFNFFLGSWNIAVDVFLALLPATIFWNLKISFSKKAKLSFLMSLGLVTAVFAAIKLKYLSNLTKRSDLTWEIYNPWVWTAAEELIIVVCGSVPAIKPLWDHTFGNKRGATWTGTPRPYKGSDYANLSKSDSSKNMPHFASKSKAIVAPYSLDELPSGKQIVARTNIDVISEERFAREEV